MFPMMNAWTSLERAIGSSLPNDGTAGADLASEAPGIVEIIGNGRRAAEAEARLPNSGPELKATFAVIKDEMLRPGRGHASRPTRRGMPLGFRRFRRDRSTIRSSEAVTGFRRPVTGPP